MAIKEQLLEPPVTIFLADLAHTNHSSQTFHTYATDLAQLCAFHQGPIETVTTEVPLTFFRKHTHLQPTTRARKQAAVAHFLAWAEQHDLLDTNSMRKIDQVKLDPPQPRGIERNKIEHFFRLLAETGLRVSEGHSLYAEDLDLSLDNEHLTVVGKGNKRRTILLDDPRLVKLLRFRYVGDDHISFSVLECEIN
jgi:integrase/recombinase XerD